MSEPRKNNSKLVEMLEIVSRFAALLGIAVDVVIMAPLSYRASSSPPLKGNAVAFLTSV
jgi:hypothetical protein